MRVLRSSPSSMRTHSCLARSLRLRVNVVRSVRRSAAQTQCRTVTEFFGSMDIFLPFYYVYIHIITEDSSSVKEAVCSEKRRQYWPGESVLAAVFMQQRGHFLGSSRVTWQSTMSRFTDCFSGLRQLYFSLSATLHTNIEPRGRIDCEESSLGATKQICNGSIFSNSARVLLQTVVITTLLSSTQKLEVTRVYLGRHKNGKLRSEERERISLIYIKPPEKTSNVLSATQP